MGLFDMFRSKKNEALKTSALVRKTHVEIAQTKDAIDRKFEHLTLLVDGALRELQTRQRDEEATTHQDNRR